MPELAELRLTADYVNKVTKDLEFNNIVKNPVHKGLDLETPFETFKISAESRGKELLLTLESGNEKKLIIMSMGMSGFFKFTADHEKHKHSHLMFESNSGTLSFVDVRRFGKWKWQNDWSENRGPDPTTEYNSFVSNIKDNLNRAAFNHPIHVALMNQKYFNGIGNYLRAEILHRLPEVNPFESARETLNKEPKIFELCKNIPLQAYYLGGGQLKDWENPFDEKPDGMYRFIRCYGNSNMSRIKDKNGRMFWFHPKWNRI